MLYEVITKGAAQTLERIIFFTLGTTEEQKQERVDKLINAKIMINQAPFVITSYSIHYTKLYEDKLNDFAKNIGDKTGDAIETTKLNSKISSEKKEISRLMQKIGEAYYEKYKNGEQPAPELLECFTEIDAHNVAISEAQAEIDKIKAPAEAPKPATTTPSANTSGT